MLVAFLFLLVLEPAYPCSWSFTVSHTLSTSDADREVTGATASVVPYHNGAWNCDSTGVTIRYISVSEFGSDATTASSCSYYNQCEYNAEGSLTFDTNTDGGRFSQSVTTTAFPTLDCECRNYFIKSVFQDDDFWDDFSGGWKGHVDPCPADCTDVGQTWYGDDANYYWTGPYKVGNCCWLANSATLDAPGVTGSPASNVDGQLTVTVAHATGSMNSDSCYAALSCGVYNSAGTAILSGGPVDKLGGTTQTFTFSTAGKTPGDYNVRCVMREGGAASGTHKEYNLNSGETCVTSDGVTSAKYEVVSGDTPISICQGTSGTLVSGSCCTGMGRSLPAGSASTTQGCCTTAGHCWDPDASGTGCVPSGTVSVSKKSICSSGQWVNCENSGNIRATAPGPVEGLTYSCTQLYDPDARVFDYEWMDIRESPITSGVPCVKEEVGDCYIQNALSGKAVYTAGCEGLPGDFEYAGCASGICVNGYCGLATNDNDNEVKGVEAVCVAACDYAKTKACSGMLSACKGQGVSDTGGCEKYAIDSSQMEVCRDACDAIFTANPCTKTVGDCATECENAIIGYDLHSTGPDGNIRYASDGRIDTYGAERHSGYMCDTAGAATGVGVAKQILYSDLGCYPAVRTVNIEITEATQGPSTANIQITRDSSVDVDLSLTSFGGMPSGKEFSDIYLFCASKCGHVAIVPVAQGNFAFTQATDPSVTLSMDAFGYGRVFPQTGCDISYTWYCVPAVTMTRTSLPVGGCMKCTNCTECESCSSCSDQMLPNGFMDCYGGDRDGCACEFASGLGCIDCGDIAPDYSGEYHMSCGSCTDCTGNTYCESCAYCDSEKLLPQTQVSNPICTTCSGCSTCTGCEPDLTGFVGDPSNLALVQQQIYALTKNGVNLWKYLVAHGVAWGDTYVSWDNPALAPYLGFDDNNNDGDFDSMVDKQYFIKVAFDDINVKLYKDGSPSRGTLCGLSTGVAEFPAGTENIYISGDGDGSSEIKCDFGSFDSTDDDFDNLLSADPETVVARFAIQPTPYNRLSVGSYRLSCKAYAGPDQNGQQLDSDVFHIQHCGQAGCSAGSETGILTPLGSGYFMVTAQLPKFTYGDRAGICDLANDGGRPPYTSCDYSMECKLELRDAQNTVTYFTKEIFIDDQVANDVGFACESGGDTQCMSFMCNEGSCDSTANSCSIFGTCGRDADCGSGRFCEKKYCRDLDCEYYFGSSENGLCMDGTTNTGYCHMGCMRDGRDQSDAVYCAGNWPGSSDSAPGCTSACVYSCSHDAASKCDFDLGENHTMEFQYGTVRSPGSVNEPRFLLCDYDVGDCGDDGSGIVRPCLDCCDLECDLLQEYTNEQTPDDGSAYYPADGIIESSYRCGTPKSGADDYDICTPSCVLDESMGYATGQITEELQKYFGLGISESSFPQNYPFFSESSGGFEAPFASNFADCAGQVSGGPECTEWCVPRQNILDKWGVDSNKHGDIAIFWGSSPQAARSYCQDIANWLDLDEAKEEDIRGDTWRTHRLSLDQDTGDNSLPSFGFTSCGLVGQNDDYGIGALSRGDDVPTAQEIQLLSHANSGAAAYVVGFILPFDPHCPGAYAKEDCEIGEEGCGPDGKRPKTCNIIAKKSEQASALVDYISLPFAMGTTSAALSAVEDPAAGGIVIPFTANDVIPISRKDYSREAASYFLDGGAPRDMWIVCSSNGNPIMFAPRYVPVPEESCTLGEGAEMRVDFELELFGKDEGERTYNQKYTLDGLSMSYRTTCGRENEDAKEDMIGVLCEDNEGDENDKFMCATNQFGDPCGCASGNFCYTHADCNIGKGCSNPDYEQSPWICTPSHRCAYEGNFGAKIQTSIYNYDEAGDTHGFKHAAFSETDFLNDPDGWQCAGPKAANPQPCVSGPAPGKVPFFDTYDPVSNPQGRVRPCDVVNVVARIDVTDDPQNRISAVAGCESISSWEIMVGENTYTDLVSVTRDIGDKTYVYIYGSRLDGESWPSYLWLPVGPYNPRKVVPIMLTCRSGSGSEIDYIQDYFTISVREYGGHVYNRCPNWADTTNWDYGSYCAKDDECISVSGAEQLCWKKEDIPTDPNTAPYLYPEAVELKQCMYRCGENPTATPKCDTEREDFLVCNECCDADGTAADYTYPGEPTSDALDWSFMDERYSAEEGYYEDAGSTCWRECQPEGRLMTRYGYTCNGVQKGTQMCSDYCEPTCGDGKCQPKFGEVVYSKEEDSYEILCPEDCCDVNSGTGLTADNELLIIDNQYILDDGQGNYFVMGLENGTLTDQMPEMPFTTETVGVCWAVCNSRQNACDGDFPETNEASQLSTSACDDVCVEKEPVLYINFFDNSIAAQDCSQWLNGETPEDYLTPCSTYTIGVAAARPLPCSSPESDNCTLDLNGVEYEIDYRAFPAGVDNANYVCKGWKDGKLVPIVYPFTSAPADGKDFEWHISLQEPEGSFQGSEVRFTVGGGMSTGILCTEDQNCLNNEDCESDLYCNTFLESPKCKPICGESYSDWIQCGSVDSPEYCENSAAGPTVGECEPDYRESIDNACADNLEEVYRFSDTKLGDCCDVSGQASKGSAYAGQCKTQCGADEECDGREPGYVSRDSLTGYVEYMCDDSCAKIGTRLEVDVSVLTDTGVAVIDTKNGISSGDAEQALAEMVTIAPVVSTRPKGEDISGATITISVGEEVVVEEETFEPGSVYALETMEEFFQKGANQISVTVEHPRLIVGEQNVTLNLFRNMLLDSRILSRAGATIDCVYRSGEPRKGCDARGFVVDVSLTDLATESAITTAEVDCSVDGIEGVVGEDGLVTFTIPSTAEVGLKDVVCTAKKENYRDAHKTSPVRLIGATGSVSTSPPQRLSPGEIYDLSVQRVVDEVGGQLYDYDWYWSIDSRRFCFNVEDCQIPSEITVGEQELQLTVFADYHEPYADSFNVSILPIRKFQVTLSPSQKYISQRGGTATFEIFLNNSGNAETHLDFAVAPRVTDLSKLSEEYAAFKSADANTTPQVDVGQALSALDQVTIDALNIELGLALDASQPETVDALIAFIETNPSLSVENTSEAIILFSESLSEVTGQRVSTFQGFASSLGASDVISWHRFASDTLFSLPSESARNFLYFDVPSGLEVASYPFTLLYKDSLSNDVSGINGLLSVTDQRIYEFELEPQSVPKVSALLGSESTFNLTLSNTGTMDDEYGFRVEGSGAPYMTVPLAVSVLATGTASAQVPVEIDGRERGNYEYRICAQSANNITGERCASGEFLVSVADLALDAPDRLSVNMGSKINFTVEVATGDIATDVLLSIEAPSIIQQDLNWTSKTLTLGANADTEELIAFTPSKDGNYTLKVRASSTKIPTLVKSQDIALEVKPPEKVLKLRDSYLQSRQLLNDLNQQIEKMRATGVEVVLSRQLSSDAEELLDEAEMLLAAGKITEAQARLNEARGILEDAIRYAELPAVEKGAAGGIPATVGIVAIVLVLAVLGGIAYAASRSMLFFKR